MAYKKLIPMIYLKEEKAYGDAACTCLLGDGDAAALAERYSENGADEIILIDLSGDDSSHERAIGILRTITKRIDTPMIVGGNVKRLEDIKKYLYAGAKTALLDCADESNRRLLKEAADRFGADKLGLWHHAAKVCDKHVTELSDAGQVVSQPPLYRTPLDFDFVESARNIGLSFILLSENEKISENPAEFEGFPAIIETDTDIETVLQKDWVLGVTGACIGSPDYDFMEKKTALSACGILMNTFTSSIPCSAFQWNKDGLIPVIVQDYKTDEVLMLAYMNEEAYQKTIATGRMTYYSRSRQELWVKGMTSGHFQYVRSIEIDCDNDTLLAKVKQVGAACHTGNRSCFYRNLISSEYAQTNPLKVFNEVMEVIEDRKLHPKEGSYTNYLFDKGIDKILKKCGEEAAEIIIAAKNPDPEEIKYEISDFLYHVMVLMSLKGVTWEDIVKELANR